MLPCDVGCAATPVNRIHDRANESHICDWNTSACVRRSIHSICTMGEPNLTSSRNSIHSPSVSSRLSASIASSIIGLSLAAGVWADICEDRYELSTPVGPAFADEFTVMETPANAKMLPRSQRTNPMSLLHGPSVRAAPIYFTNKTDLD